MSVEKSCLQRDAACLETWSFPGNSPADNRTGWLDVKHQQLTNSGSVMCEIPFLHLYRTSFASHFLFSLTSFIQCPFCPSRICFRIVLFYCAQYSNKCVAEENYVVHGLSILCGKHEGMLVLHSSDYLVGLVVKASALGPEDPEFDSRLRHGDFSGSSHTSD